MLGFRASRWIASATPSPTPPGPSYFTSFNPYTALDDAGWQAESGNPTASVRNVGTGKDYASIAAAIAAANSKDLIQLFVGGTDYANGGTLGTFIPKDLTYRQIDRVVVLSGTTQFDIRDTNTFAFEGLVFNSSAQLPIVFNAASPISVVRRCLFTNTTNMAVGVGAGTCLVEGCIFDTVTGAGFNAGCWAGTLTVKNCHVVNSTVVGYAQGAPGVVNVYNATSFSTAADFDGTVGGDYNLSSDATAPGVNSLKSQLVGAHFTGYVPTSEFAKSGGDPLQAASYDYYGNALPFGGVAPVGAIYAE